MGTALLVPPAVQSGRSKKTAAPAQPSFEKSVAPVVQKYCVTCHSGGNAPAGVVLTGFKDANAVMAKRDLWDQVAQNVSANRMPPEGAPQPSKAQRAAMVTWLQTAINGSCKLKDPGHVTMRRLNREEYDNTVRDLTGLDLHLSNDFPSDDVGYGFDNIGDVLSLSPLLMEKYLHAAEVIADRAIVVPDSAPTHFDAENLKLTNGVEVSDKNEVFFFSNGQATAEKYLTMAGTYKLKAMACGQQAGPDPCKMAFLVDGQTVQTVDVKATEGHEQLYEIELQLDAGKHKFGVAFTNDFYVKGPPVQDRNMIVRYLDLYTPAPKASALPDSHKRIIFETPAPGSDWRPDAKQILSKFALRAFRRPATTEEMTRLMQIADYVHKDGQPFEKSIQLGVQAILSSPHFLFRVEPVTSSPTIGSFELASRLSYFLWSSMPDDQLFALAANGQIEKPAILEAQIKRMLADPRSGSLADNFAEEWLNLRKLALIFPDPAQFPDFNDKLRADMMKETKLFFSGVVQNDRSILDFLDAKYSYMNADLAKHYGIPGVDGEEFRKVSLAGTPREGVLTQGSVLTLTSNPTRTSPVKRGKWVLENILDTPPPPPPPNVGVLPDDDGKQIAAATLREKMEQHRKNPMCASCHKKMDPLGFSLENFDATGGWRAKDGDVAIDDSGVLPDGTKFKGAPELCGILMKDKAEFIHGMAEKLLTYAIGRGVESYDKCSVDDIARVCTEKGYKFSALVMAVVSSDPFRKQRVVGGKAK